jgi:hypothetical protein
MNLFGALAAADINGDNKPDVIHADNQNDQVVVYLSRW